MNNLDLYFIWIFQIYFVQNIMIRDPALYDLLLLPGKHRQECPV